ncbi:E3 ubiquitin-protein ligase HACE1-like [Watersipora subatra]|uniref:E3 ubiquitin-protein ligase HACE1-like n=1 Tax=Watersipora subatra TaxID=2589382 RepID=UPI00355B4B37
MEGFLHKLRTSLQKGRGVTLPEDRKAAINLLISTIFANDVSTLDDLLSNSGFDVNSTFHRTKRTLLLASAQANAYDCLCLLIKKGADVNISDVSGTTPFLAACRNGHRRIVKKLILDKEVDVQKRDMSGLTGIHWMAASGRVDCLSDCISLIHDIDILDEQGQTPLHVAAKNGHLKAMELLIEHGAQLNIAANSGDTPLHFACTNGQLPGLNLLLSKNVLYQTNKKDEYPAEMAVEGEHWTILYRLVEYFPDTMLPSLIQLTVKDGVDERKILLALKNVAEHFSTLDDVLTQLANMASHAGLKLLTPYSILDIELFVLMRCINTLTGLCENASSQQIKLVQQALADVWSSMESWFNLLSEKMASSSEPGQELSHSDTLGVSPSDPKSVKGKDIELHTICPRISCILQAFYAITLLDHQQVDTTPESFLRFLSAHEKEVEFLIRRNPQVIFEHFEFLLSDSQANSRLFKFVKIQPFVSRKEWFYKQLYRVSADAYSPGSMEDILIARDSLFTSSCHQLLRRDPNDLKRNLMIKFKDEEGLGQGVVKDWFDALSQELLNPDYALFTVSPDGSTFQPNPLSHVNPDHLNYFNFAGQIIGLAIYHKQLVSVYFTRSFYKHILGIPVNYRDVESIDPEYARNLQWILDNDITDLNLDLTFSVENNAFGVQEMIALKKDGSKLPVTEENKKEYVQLVTELRMTRSIQPQINSFLQGFHKFIPERLVHIFDEFELELLMSGLPDIDVGDWKQNTDYIGFSEEDSTVQWFWQLLLEMDREERVQILQFSTGSSRVPFGGFGHLRGGDGEQKFTISKVETVTKRLPTSSTCINMLKLPVYQSKEELRQYLKLSIDSCTGFQVA